MTARELLKQLSECDEDILDYEIGVITSVQLTRDVRLTGRYPIYELQENADVDSKKLWMKAKV